jgi:hypothetical protein
LAERAALADGLRPGHSTQTEGDSSAFAPLRNSTGNFAIFAAIRRAIE